MMTNSAVPIAVKPSMRPITISPVRTGFVTTVKIVRLLMSAGKLKALKNRANSITR